MTCPEVWKLRVLRPKSVFSNGLRIMNIEEFAATSRQPANTILVVVVLYVPVQTTDDAPRCDNLLQSVQCCLALLPYDPLI